MDYKKIALDKKLSASFALWLFAIVAAVALKAAVLMHISSDLPSYH